MFKAEFRLNILRGKWDAEYMMVKGPFFDAMF